jgi:uncharacterized OB-fold protein
MTHESPPVIENLSTPVDLAYRFTAGRAQERWLRSIRKGRLTGFACPQCGNDYFPPLGNCALDGTLLEKEVDLPGTGTITAFTIVNIEFFGQELQIPYVFAQVVLDGADVPFYYPVGECAPTDARVGMRVEVLWRDEADWDLTLANIRYLRPIDEPDAYPEFVRSFQ